MKHGNELEKMLAGKKPMAVFYRATTDKFDEKSGQNFDAHVRQGKFKRFHFYLINDKYKMHYVVYTLNNEQWRAQVYKTIKRIGQQVWNEDMQEIENLLLDCCDIRYHNSHLDRRDR